MTAAKLNAKQRLFAAEYMKDMNATRAAIRAGYSPRSAYSTGERMLRNAEVAAEVGRLIGERIERTGVEADRVVEELARLAFSDLREHVEWGPNYVRLKESAGLTDEAAAAVAEVAKTISENGASYKIKLHDKLGALRLLAQHVGLIGKEGGVNVNQYNFDLSGVPTDELRRVQRLIDGATVPPT